MTDFIRRVRRLQQSLGPRPSLVTVIYADGNRRTMHFLDAVIEACNPNAVGVETDDVAPNNLLSALFDSKQDDFDDIDELAE